MSSTVSKPLPTSLLTVAGCRLDYRVMNESGLRPTVVFLHDGLGSIELWRTFPDDVVEATDHRGLVYSRYGHGWSDPATEPRPIDFVEREALVVLPSVLEQLDACVPVLIGHSDGGSISLVYAAHHPVAALVLLAPHVFVEAVGLDTIATLGQQFADGELAGKMAKYHRDPVATFRAWNDVWLDRRFASWNIEYLLNRIECPVLLIQGRDDEYGTMAQIDAIERQIAGPVERVELNECGHAPHLSQPALTLEATVDFVRNACGRA
ncbi:MAG TPA: alpha/beta hydrolase [Actinobacteria bacterium]|nr:alpha/beta hydrolase [Actinomycetota bacterium]